MKNKFCKTAICVLLAIMFFAGNTVAFAKSYTADDAKGLIGGISAFNMSQSGASSEQEMINSTFTGSMTMGYEWYVLSFVQLGRGYDYSSYKNALVSYVTSNNIPSAVTREKLALTLIALNCQDENGKAFISSACENSIGKQGVMSYVFGLHLLTNGCKSSSYTASSVISQLLSIRNSDGGWSVSGGVSDVDVTAMVLQSLAPYYASSDVTSAVDTALALLSDRQGENGDFASYGVYNAESTAQVIIALNALSLDVNNDARFIKNGNSAMDGLLKYRLSDGSFSHKDDGSSSQSATAQAMCALVSVWRNQTGRGSFYKMPAAFVPNTVIENHGSGDNYASISSSDGGGNAGTITDNDKNAIGTTASAENQDGQNTENPTESVADDTNISADTENNISTLLQKSNTNRIGYKLIASICIAVFCGIVSLVLFILKKRNYKNFVVIAAIGAVLIAAVCLTNFQSAGSYYNGVSQNKQNSVGTVTLAIRCDTVAGSENAPENPKILPSSQFQIEQGETVYDLLTEASRQYSIPFEHNGNSYISGINNLYEFDFGSLSGWIYKVNGVAPSVGCSEYTLSPGDEVEWLYTCDSGNDV